jgi:hypothetical protein
MSMAVRPSARLLFRVEPIPGESPRAARGTQVRVLGSVIGGALSQSKLSTNGTEL